MKNGSPTSRNLTYMVSVSYSSSPTFCALRDGLPNLTYMGSASYSPLPSFCTLRDGNVQFGSVLCMPTPLSLGADEVSDGEFVMAAAHHGYFYDKGDSL